MTIWSRRKNASFWCAVLSIAALVGCSTDNQFSPAPLPINEGPSQVDDAFSDTSPDLIENATLNEKEDSFAAGGGTNFGTLGIGGSEKSETAALRVVRVFFATNRKVEVDKKDNKFFSSSRGSKLHYGDCEVTIPAIHRIGELERPSLWRLELKENPEAHIVLRHARTLRKERFLSHLRDHAKGSGGRVILYVHGFNTSFHYAALRAAQLKDDLDFPGQIIFFSWPSYGDWSAYPKDLANIEWSMSHAASVLSDLLNNDGISEVIVVAHSMGAFGIMSATSRNSAALGKNRSKLREIILAAPDIDRDVFVKDILPALGPSPPRVTLYASDHDKALSISERFHGVPRLGSMKPNPVIAKHVDTIDASLIDASFKGHTYYAENKSIISDMFYLVNERLEPSRRATLRRNDVGDNFYWAFR